MTTKKERRRRKQEAARDRRPDPSVPPRRPMGLWDWIETWVDDVYGIDDSLTSGGVYANFDKR